MASAGFSVEQWRAEIEQAFASRSEEGMSSRDLAEAMQVSIRTVGERIRALAAQGRLIVGYRWEPSALPNRRKKVPVYRIKKK